LELNFPDVPRVTAAKLIDNQLEPYAVVASYFPYVEGSFCHTHTAQPGSPH
jgi:hypothetical protein